MSLPPDYSSDRVNGLWTTIVERATPFNLSALIIFVCAIIHTFFAGSIRQLAYRLEKKCIVETEAKGESYSREEHLPCFIEVIYFLGEVEVVFALWVIPLVIAITHFYSWETAVDYLNTRNYREPLLVIVIMALAASRPIITLAEKLLRFVARAIGGTTTAWWFTLLTIGPLLGSLITEPGAMTITALLLSRQFYVHRPPPILAYATLGLLFVNVSVGGVLDHFAAPPVLIVAERWGLTSSYMFFNFGWKSIVGILASNTLYFFLFRRQLAALKQHEDPLDIRPVPLWVIVVHIVLLAAIVITAHDPVIFIGIFLLYIGFHEATSPHQHRLHLRAPFLVGLFLAGLVIHGAVQSWWISPMLSRLSELPLMLLTTVLTAFNDNAALTYLSSLTPNMTESLRYAVMAGAITGGGLTVIANAPNPAGQQILGPHFHNGVRPLRLFLGALTPTIIMLLVFIFF